MAGLIQIGKKQCSVAGWGFDHVLRLARQQLPSDRSTRVLELIDEAATGLNHLSLDNLSRDDLSIFYEALEQAYFQNERVGPGAFSTPQFYSGFMDRFHELLEMIRSSGKIS